MKEVLKKQWSYTLYESDEGYALSVICGTVALYTIQVQLNEEEVDAFKVNGVDYIDSLVKTIQSEPDKFKDRGMSS